MAMACRGTAAVAGGRSGSLNGHSEEVAEYLAAVLGEDRLGMELHALDRQLAVPDRHDLAILGRSGHVEHRRQARALDGERMVARRVEWRRHVLENTALVVDDRRQLAVHDALRTDHPGTESLP